MSAANSPAADSPAARPTVLASLADRLGRGETLLSAWCGLPDPSVSGLLAQEDFDVVTLDMQHGPITLAEVIRAVPLINAAGKPAVARIPVGEFQNVSKLFDSGLSGVIAPMINTLEDARRFAAYAKYPPLGERSWGSYGGLGASGLDPNSYLREANRFSMTFAMIETREAMAIVDEIVALEGIDALFVGPSDLSIALSNGASVNAAAKEVNEALRHIVGRAAAVNKPVAFYAATAERAKEGVEMGARFVTVMSDSGMLRAASKAALKVVRG